MNRILYKLILICLLNFIYTEECDIFCLHGVCKNQKCICDNCYTGIKCEYRQSRAWVAFMWECIFPIGMGHFYIGNIIIGLIKITLMIGILCYPYIYSIYIIRNAMDDEYQMLTEIGLNALFLKGRILQSKIILICIYITDLVCLFFGLYSDSNGIDLC